MPNNQAQHSVCKSQSCQVFIHSRLEHREVIIKIIKYLKATHHLGLYFKPDASKGFQCYCDAGFAVNWNKEHCQI
ncbi:hypothetical protein ACHAW6_015553 [Cyclotella cf. meneghiniana]